MAGFKGTERFTILRRLGAGGFGEVFAAYDHQRQEKVALKVPHESKAKTIYRFKREFRTLADVTHPNLVSLFELFTHGPDWFFTMELVDGSNFNQRLRPQEACPPDSDSDLGSLWRDLTPYSSEASFSSFAEEATRGVELPGNAGGIRTGFDSGDLSDFIQAAPPRDYEEVRDLSRQLAEGLLALHEAGILHRDIKPTNVLVTREGRVVLVDFGLAMDRSTRTCRLTDEKWVTGTPGYIAPEQMLGQASSEASDWFSVGVMIYQGLTGHLPFPGSDLAAILDRMAKDPPAPELLVPETPGDLNDLCLELLCPDPLERPSGRQILRRLGGVVRFGEPVPAGAAGLPGGPLPGDAQPVGRGDELRALDQAFEASRLGKAVVAVVQGRSGMGKTFLLRHFIEQLQRRSPKTVVLAGRCFEQESVPYKALDDLMDAISQYLLGLSKLELGDLLPVHMPYLARLFPVLRQVEGLDAPPGPAECPDPQEFRRRAFTALRRLLCALGDRHPLVLFIDDLQWGDRDSFALLESLLRPPDAPAMLVLVTLRQEDDPLPQEYLGFRENLAGARVDAREFSVAELPEPAARQLAQALLGPQFEAAMAAWIAREAAGNPYFIAELAQQAVAERACPGNPDRLASTGPQTLETFILSRVAGLAPESRRILDVIAVAGHPVDWEILARACGPELPRPELLTGLRAANFIRAKGQTRNLVETFHDRIRVTVAKEIPVPRAQELHYRLARAMEESAKADPRALAFHFQQAGEMVKAASYAELAAEQAAKALAFEQAARFFRQALECRPALAEGRLELLAKLGDALANAGLGAEAAQAYGDAAAASRGHQAVRFRRKTAEQYFRCGQFDQGMATLRTVLATLNMRIPASPWRALVSALFRRALIQLRGLDCRLRPEPEIPREELDRIDICWAGAMGLGPIDHILGVDFQARQLGLTLKAGEPHRLVRALAHEAIYVAHRGSRSLAATQRILATTLAHANQVGEPGPLSRAYIAAGTAALLQGRWKASMELHEKAEALLAGRCTGMDYELHISQHHALVCHWILGDVEVVAARLPSCLQAAREKNDLLMTTNLRTSVAPYLYLAQDDPERAQAEIRQAMAHWSSKGFHIQHYNALVAQANLHLYEGRPGPAWELITSQWSPLRNSLLLQVQSFLITMLEIRARAGLALAQTLPPQSRRRRTLLRSAQDDRRRILGERTSYGDALALKLQALEALAREQPVAAAALCLQAEIAFGASDMGLHAMAVRLVRGRLEAHGGSEARWEAEAWLRERGIVQPERFVGMHLPAVVP